MPNLLIYLLIFIISISGLLLFRINHILHIRQKLITWIYEYIPNTNFEWEKRRRLLLKYSFNRMIFMLHKRNLNDFYPEVKLWVNDDSTDSDI